MVESRPWGSRSWRSYQQTEAIIKQNPEEKCSKAWGNQWIVSGIIGRHGGTQDPKNNFLVTWALVDPGPHPVSSLLSWPHRVPLRTSSIIYRAQWKMRQHCSLFKNIWESQESSFNYSNLKGSLFLTAIVVQLKQFSIRSRSPSVVINLALKWVSLPLWFLYNSSGIIIFVTLRHLALCFLPRWLLGCLISPPREWVVSKSRSVSG